MLMQQITVAFDFELLGEQMLGGHDVYVLLATPRGDINHPILKPRY